MIVFTYFLHMERRVIRAIKYSVITAFGIESKK
jgi:hypothetical protein